MDTITKTPETISDEATSMDISSYDSGQESQSTQSNKAGLIKAAIALGGLAAAAGAYFAVIRPWHLKWGATDEEAEGKMPGDELVPEAKSITHSITIEAPVANVWPLLAELGQNKGGVYRLTWLENIIPADEIETGNVEATWQDLKIGDIVKIHNNYPPAPVVALEYRHFMVLGLDLCTDKAATWSFVLKPVEAKNDKGETVENTRLTIRFRETEKSGMGKVLDVVATEPVQFVLERKMLLTIKKLAEDLVGQTKAS